MLTDYCLHKIWIHPHVNQYYVATNDLKKQMLRTGVPEAHVHVTGIPIRPVLNKLFHIHLFIKNIIYVLTDQSS